MVTMSTTPQSGPSVTDQPGADRSVPEGVDPSAPTLRDAIASRLHIDDVASSREGVTFTFQTAAASSVQVGSYLVLDAPDGTLLGQVQHLEFVARPGPEVHVTFDQPVRVRAGGVADGGTVRVDVRVVEGGGQVLGRIDPDGAIGVYGGPGFLDAPLRPATDAEVASLVDSVKGATLDAGSLVRVDAPARLVAAGFARHTFLCGQSGSGKTYSTGVLLEQLLARTDLRLVVLDPNSDHVHLDEVGPQATGDDAERLREVARRVEVLSGDGLRLHIPDLEPELQARLLRLDPLADLEEYHAFRRLLARQATHPIADLRELDDLQDPVVRGLVQRAENLGLLGWGLWGRLDPTSVLRRLDDDDWRALVVDLGSLRTQAERDVTAAAVLGRLWSRRADRRPVLLVIDEAHNVAPDVTEDPVRAMASDLAVTIAGEGRKFGLHLLVATQRPSKVHPNVVSQCDNLVLMRLNSRSDTDDVARIFSHVPEDMVCAAPTFGLGQALVAGRISPVPQLLRFGARLTPEGGGDVPTTWATPGR